MDRKDFEALRDLPDKIIRSDIKFSQKRQTSPAMTADGIEIENSAGIALRLNLTFNPDADSKTINVSAMGVGPICRLDVDGPVHEPVGRSHKHSLRTDRCAGMNLPGVTERSDLAGRSLQDLFVVFCEMAKIEHIGTFFPPEG